MAFFSVIGFFQGCVIVFSAESAMQQAAGAAMGIAWAVIPYCICSALQMMKKTDNSQTLIEISQKLSEQLSVLRTTQKIDITEKLDSQGKRDGNELEQANMFTAKDFITFDGELDINAVKRFVFLDKEYIRKVKNDGGDATEAVSEFKYIMKNIKEKLPEKLGDEFISEYMKNL